MSESSCYSSTQSTTHPILWPLLCWEKVRALLIGAIIMHILFFTCRVCQRASSADSATILPCNKQEHSNPRVSHPSVLWGPAAGNTIYFPQELVAMIHTYTIVALDRICTSEGAEETDAGVSSSWPHLLLPFFGKHLCVCVCTTEASCYLNSHDIGLIIKQPRYLLYMW